MYCKPHYIDLTYHKKSPIHVILQIKDNTDKITQEKKNQTFVNVIKVYLKPRPNTSLELSESSLYKANQIILA